MSLAKTYSAQLNGLDIEVITVEVDISNGLHSFSIVGLGDRSVGESKDRISAAIKNSGMTSPKQKNQRLVISLAPAHIKKEGSSFDLAMSIAYLVATGDIEFDYENKILLGELTLEGNIRKVSGVLPIIYQAKKMGFTQAFIPRDNIGEVSIISGIDIIPVSTLREMVDHINRHKVIPPVIQTVPKSIFRPDIMNMNSIVGNEQAKRGLEISAAGGHNLLMYGPPGTGKTMLAKAFHGILPALTLDQSIEITSLHSVANVLNSDVILTPPFRSPHHTASYSAMVGGGSIPKPGEISLAHNGVLFLDEFPEFNREVIESLRQPMEDGHITIARTKGTTRFPARFTLIATMNPCPCGKETNKCTCTPKMIDKYKEKISGPISDRIDIWLNVNKINYDRLAQNNSKGESSKEILGRIGEARTIQENRYKTNHINKKLNSEMSTEDIEKIANISRGALDILTDTAKKMSFSARTFHRIIKVSRTIADLDKKEEVGVEHILEAISYRPKS